MCPRDERCEAGRCVPLMPGEDGGVPPVDAGARDGGAGADGGTGGRRASSGCGCSVPSGSRGAPLAWLALLGLVVGWRRRRA